MMIKKQPTKIIHWGIIGLGSIANKFAQDLLTIKDAKLHAVASRTQEKANAFAIKYQATIAYSSYEALVKDPLIDVVYIATPHALHMKNTLLCLDHNMAVLCEKPFAMNSDQVAAMIAKAKAKNTLLMEALWTYFLPQYKYVLDVLEAKTYGKLLKIEADFGFYREFDNSARLFNKALGGGSLLDIGIYPIFIALSTLGMPDNIEAKATTFKNGVDASCDVLFSYNNGEKAILKSTLKTDTPTVAIFHCETGCIKINENFYAPTTVTIHHNNEEKLIDFTEQTHGYKHEILHINNLLRSDKTESPIMTFNFSTKLITLLDKVRSIINLEY